MSPRPRDQILGNLETVYREAYDRAKTTGDERRMSSGMRVRARWRDQTEGLLSDLACFEPEEAG